MAIVRVNTNYGMLEGVAEEGYSVFKGIPYAKPPIGPLRFCPPQPAEPWEGIYEAKSFSSKCMQTEGSGGFYDKEFYDEEDYCVSASEDGLYLNVWTPAEREGERLPVAFWIHGGAFMGGFGSEKEFDGEQFCRQGVILVTINYRLNLFGFLAHPWLSEESGQQVSGNYGILDQIAALKWVKENIAHFGGDPDRITVLGQSAGAMSVQTLISSPLTKGMISRAILQSGGGYHNGMNRDFDLKEAEEIGKRFTELAGISTLEELRAKPVEELYEAFGQLMKETMEKGMGLVMQPVVDGFVLPYGYDEQIEKGMVHSVPYMLGSNLNDIFVSPEDVERGIPSKLYQGCIDFSERLQAAGHAPSYVYFFKRKLPGDEAGAFHSAELWYMFGTLDRCWRPLTEKDHQLSREMVGYWTNFMKSGDPNGEGLAPWRPCAEGDRFVMEFDVE